MGGLWLIAAFKNANLNCENSPHAKYIMFQQGNAWFTNIARIANAVPCRSLLMCFHECSQLSRSQVPRIVLFSSIFVIVNISIEM